MNIKNSEIIFFQEGEVLRSDFRIKSNEKGEKRRQECEKRK